MSKKTSRDTRAVRAGIDTDSQHGAVMPPLVMSANFSFDGFGGKRKYDYTRSGNPTRDLLGEALAELEEGHGAVVTNTGMSAVVLVTHLLAADELVVAPKNCYGGCYRAFNSLAGKGRFRTAFTDFSDSVKLREECLRLRPKLIWVETPSNPLLQITDIRRVAVIARECGALLVVDNTFLTPMLQQPLKLGADIVVHSTTKYINGHSDVVGGAVIAKSQALHEQLAWWANALGLTAGAFDSFLTLRGLRTLEARLAVHGRNAGELAVWLAAQPGIRKVYYPGLPDHVGHDIAKRQQHGYGASVTIEIDGGEAAVRRFVDGLAYFSLAESLGGVESLIAHPGSMTHAAMAPEARAAAGLVDGLLRLSIGIEAVDDLRHDLAAALQRARG
jgi:cystathionine gamma-synthase